MIKVKTFFPNSQNPLHLNRLDSLINAFIAENDIEVIDIKYDTSAVNTDSGIIFYPSAMLIYRAKAQR